MLLASVEEVAPHKGRYVNEEQYSFLVRISRERRVRPRAQVEQKIMARRESFHSQVKKQGSGNSRAP